jgi:gluconate 2-dehydrogenase gamma chain
MPPGPLRRRQLLASTALLLAGCATTATQPPASREGGPPVPVTPGPWRFFTPEEGATIEALVERLIPPDELSVSGREAGCGVFIDRQLAGPYGSSERLYMRPPFASGTPMQGAQSPLTPAARYRQGLAALHAFCRIAYVGRLPHDLAAVQIDALLKGLESGQMKLDGADGRGLFELLLANTMEGFFADPLYGGNQGFAGWNMIGFPGARYDYRDEIAHRNQPIDVAMVGITGRPDWTRKGT